MDRNIYTAKDYEISFPVKIHNYFAGLFGRKDLLKNFCIKNGIDYKPVQGRTYKLPNQYLINHDELKYLSSIRDKAFLVLYEDYAKEQAAIEEKCIDLQSNIATQQETIDDNQTNLTSLKQSLRSTKDSLLRIDLQDRISQLETKIKNERLRLKEDEAILASSKTTIASNRDNWKKQIDILENVFEIRKKSFEKNISKKIRESLNFTSFDSHLAPYSESVKQILNGDYYEQK